MATEQAEEAVSQATSASNINLVGFHFHLGSPIFELEPYRLAIELVLSFIRQMKRKYSFQFDEFGVGGGFAVQYSLDSKAPDVAEYAQAIAGKLNELIPQFELDHPKLIIEPGRRIVAQDGVALYKVGVIKAIPGVRRYVSVDGGMADNVRPALYGAKYEALVANKASASETEKVTIAGKFCESGDILIRDINLPTLSAGDLIAIPESGAYCLSMASNYNAALKPAIVLVKEGSARLIRRRETFDDLTRCDSVHEAGDMGCGR